MTMEGLINTFCETFHPITYAASVLQHALRNSSYRGKFEPKESKISLS